MKITLAEEDLASTIILVKISTLALQAQVIIVTALLISVQVVNMTATYLENVIIF